MSTVLDCPPLVLALALLVLWFAAMFGSFLRRRRIGAAESARQDDLGTVLPAALTLLGLIIGFSFSMAVARYDQRKNLEEAEANAIGTEYVRADLLPAAEAAQVRTLLAKYVEQRLLFYRVRDPEQRQQIDADTAALQNKLWSAILAPVLAQPTPISSLVTAGMNDVLNSQGYTQAAWWNRIPTGAWLLMGLIAAACNLLLGYGEWHRPRAWLLILPLLVGFSFFLIADIDSPSGGVIRVAPQNLIALDQSLKAH